MTVRDWSPAEYGAFADLRLRPALDLLEAVGPIPDGPVIDLGCGAGAAGPALRARFGDRIEGLDTSPAMLAEARATGAYAALAQADIAAWAPDAPPALIFSNAVLHWLADHATLVPRLVRRLVPGGTLAVQMPDQFDEPSHRLIRETAAALFPDRFDLDGWHAPVAGACDYHRLVAPLGSVKVWRTAYLQRLGPDPDAHPVRRFTQSTACRPVLARLTAAEAAAFLGAYDAALAAAYPAEPDGAVLMPFHRLFLTCAP